MHQPRSRVEPGAKLESRCLPQQPRGYAVSRPRHVTRAGGASLDYRSPCDFETVLYGLPRSRPYLLGDKASSTAIIVDPQRDIQQYLADAGKSRRTRSGYGPRDAIQRIALDWPMYGSQHSNDD